MHRYCAYDSQQNGKSDCHKLTVTLVTWDAWALIRHLESAVLVNPPEGGL